MAGSTTGDATGGIDRVPAAGGSSPESLKNASSEESYDNISLLPGARYVLHGIWDLDTLRKRVVVTELGTGETTDLFAGGFAPRYVSSGHLLVAQEDLLLAMTFDVDTLAVGPRPVLRGLSTDLMESIADYAVAESGALAFLHRRRRTGGLAGPG